MKRSLFGLFLVAYALASVMAGCSALSPAQTADSDSLKGFWVLDESSQVGFDAALNLDEGDLAELMVSDLYLEGVWTTDGKDATITFADTNKTAKVFVSEDKLTLGDASGSKLVFVKGDLDEYFANQGNGGDDENYAGNSADSSEGIGGSDEDIEEIAPITLVDDDTCKIVVTGKGTDFTGDPGYRLALTNNTDSSIYLMCDESFTVGDKEIGPGMGEVVDAGKTVETFMYFPKDELEGGAEALADVAGTIIVGDNTTGKEIASYLVNIG